MVAIDAALGNPEYTQEYVKEVIEVSKPMIEAFLDKQNIEYWPSVANYVWVFFKQPSLVEQKLKEANILVRPKVDSQARCGLRITLGNKQQTSHLIDTLASAL